ncbi:DUF1178 family protein [Methyloferula stellata]|uniref:DUF1178 family protein n=1 Tax=Methyloferula stellata TaxID=876270 RepID=UPI000369A14D|nr:DUF1178 family protein [Methyloferula stellata]
MIKFSLVCDSGHSFESWFANGAAYDQQAEGGFVHCPICGSARVTKAIMAPAIASHLGRGFETRAAESRVIEGEIIPPQPAGTNALPPALLDEQQHAVRAMIGAMRAKILTDTIDVGKDFPEEARKMHEGESPERPIRGEATVEEAHALIEDGIKIMAVPAAPDELN